MPLLLPNRNTIGLVAVLVAMWYAGVAQGNGAAHLLCFLVAALAAVSAVHAWGNVRRVSVRVGRVAPVFAGERVRVPVVLDCEPGARPAVGLRVDAGDASHAVLCAEVAGRDGWRTVVDAPAGRRGRYEQLRVSVESRYPLGFWTARRRALVEQVYYVYPRPAGVAPLPDRAAAGRARSDGGRRMSTLVEN